MLHKSKMIHHNGENNTLEKQTNSDLITVDTFSGRVHIDWEPNAAVTPNGQMGGLKLQMRHIKIYDIKINNLL